jgi:competence ComEA-like helix-hairpin-helix protein
LQLVPGIGPSTAEKILQMRKSYGAFKSVNDLMAIRGIGPKRLEKMRKYLTVGRSAATGSNTAQPASCSRCAKTNTDALTKSAATQKTPPPTEQPPEETEEPKYCSNWAVRRVPQVRSMNLSLAVEWFLREPTNLAHQKRHLFNGALTPLTVPDV